MTSAPTPPPRGGAEPRVSALNTKRLEYIRDGLQTLSEAGSKAAAVEILDLRAKLEAADAERDALKARPSDGIWTCGVDSLKKLRSYYANEDAWLAMVVLMVNQDVAEAEVRADAAEAKLAHDIVEIRTVNARVCAERDAAETALREMTKQRDRAWKAALDAAAAVTAQISKSLDSYARMHEPPSAAPNLELAHLNYQAAAAVTQVEKAVRALAPPAETAAKEERT